MRFALGGGGGSSDFSDKMSSIKVKESIKHHSEQKQTNNNTNSESACGRETMQKHAFARFGSGCGHQATAGWMDTSDPSSEERHATIGSE